MLARRAYERFAAEHEGFAVVHNVMAESGFDRTALNLLGGLARLTATVLLLACTVTSKFGQAIYRLQLTIPLAAVGLALALLGLVAAWTDKLTRKTYVLVIGIVQVIFFNLLLNKIR